MTDQTLRQRTRERAKLVVRRTLGRANLDIGRDPYVNRLRRSLDHAGIDTVIDIGANVGQFGQMVRHAGFAGRIVSVEPLDSAHGVLAKRASGDPQWSTVHAAVGAEPGSTTINVAGNSYSSSLLTMTQRHLSADPKSATIGTQDVQVTTVAELVRDHAVAPERSLLKVDTQGYERQVLDGAGTCSTGSPPCSSSSASSSSTRGSSCTTSSSQDLGHPRTRALGARDRDLR